jgi:hypothetical protein
VLHARVARALGGPQALPHLGFDAVLERRRHQEERVGARGGAPDRGRVLEIALVHFRPERANALGRIRSASPRERPHAVTALEEQACDRSSLAPRRTGDEDGDGLRHGASGGILAALRRTVRAEIAPFRRQDAGRMFWFSRKRLPGSYFALSCVSRARFGP